jgi:thiosulfate/3-mercaptopyruvate sulfurtransferase
MKPLLTLIFAVVWSAAVSAAPPLLSPTELNGRLTDPKLLVIDIRDPKSYATQHISGAVNAPYGAWRGAASNPGELPALAKLTKLVQSLGLTPDQHAVVVSSGSDATDFGASARVYWTLKVLGLKELSVLNGGVKAWTLAGLPQTNVPAKVVESTFSPQIDRSMVATREDLIQRVKSGESTLIDARPAEFFQGNTRHAAAPPTCPVPCKARSISSTTSGLHPAPQALSRPIKPA